MRVGDLVKFEQRVVLVLEVIDHSLVKTTAGWINKALLEVLSESKSR